LAPTAPPVPRIRLTCRVGFISPSMIQLNTVDERMPSTPFNKTVTQAITSFFFAQLVKLSKMVISTSLCVTAVRCVIEVTACRLQRQLLAFAPPRNFRVQRRSRTDEQFPLDESRLLWPDLCGPDGTGTLRKTSHWIWRHHAQAPTSGCAKPLR
jgi:hypothetical protein